MPTPDPRREAATGPANLPPRQHWLWFAALLFLNYLLVRLPAPSPEAPVPVPYTLFREEVGKGNVQAIYSRGETITGRFKIPVAVPPPVADLSWPSAAVTLRGSCCGHWHRKISPGRVRRFVGTAGQTLAAVTPTISQLA